MHCVEQQYACSVFWKFFTWTVFSFFTYFCSIFVRKRALQKYYYLEFYTTRLFIPHKYIIETTTWIVRRCRDFDRRIAHFPWPQCPTSSIRLSRYFENSQNLSLLESFIFHTNIWGQHMAYKYKIRLVVIVNFLNTHQRKLFDICGPALSLPAIEGKSTSWCVSWTVYTARFYMS